MFLLLPLAGLLYRAPWSGLGPLLTDPSVRQALRLSLVSSVLATLVSLLFGVPLAWVLARLEFPGRRVLRSLVLLPLVLPPVVGGVGLLYALGRGGLLGDALGAIGVSLPFTTAGVVVAETFVAMPFLIIAVEGALASSDLRYDEAAATLGASGWTTFRRVTLPMIAPSIGAGAVLTFARALGEFGATITFVAAIPGLTLTLPADIYQTVQTPGGEARAWVLCALSAAIALGAVWASNALAPRLSR